MAERDPLPMHEHAALGAEGLFCAHARFVASFLRHMGVPHADLDDLTQEVFVVAHRRGGYQPGPATPRTWLSAIAFRVAKAAQRVRARGPVGVAELELLGDDTSDAADTLDAKRALARVEAALGQLSFEQRAVFVLFELEGEDCESIAATLSVPIGTVYSRLHHARRAFFKAYRREAGPLAGRVLALRRGEP
jgi:RNA polymerase sigma-70 factor (ECF subfamily)